MDWQTGSNDKLAGVCNNLIHFEHVAFVVGSTATCESLSTLATTTICVGRVQRRTECVATTCLTEYASQIVLHRVCFRECVAPTCLTHPGKSPPSTGGARRDVVLNCPALHCTTLYQPTLYHGPLHQTCLHVPTRASLRAMQRL